MLCVGLYGSNGHQVPVNIPVEIGPDIPARVAAVAAITGAALDTALGVDTPERLALRVYDDLDGLLDDPEVELIALCSPRRSEQARQAMRALEAGKHVYAEKPAAFTNAELDTLLATAERTGRCVHQMSDTLLALPVQAMRRLVESGVLGTITQVQAQKSYPWHDARPQQVEIDGGLIRQAGIHAMNFIVGATGLRIAQVQTFATGLGNPGNGPIHMAASCALTLENGAVGAINMNYFNPTTFGAWGNDQLRIIGTKGMVESVDGFRRSRLYLNGQDPMDLPQPDQPHDGYYFAHYVNYLTNGTPFPTSFAEEMHALRAIIAAHESAELGAAVHVSPHVP
jgi:predicted dehydrogenase